MPPLTRIEYEPLSELEIPRSLIGAPKPPDYDSEFVSGSLLAIHAQGGEKVGFFEWKSKWFEVEIRPDQPMKLIRLKGVRVKFNYDDHGRRYIKIYRTANAENINIL